MIAPRPPTERCWIGCDVGSTAVKAVAVESQTLRVLERSYLLHGTRQSRGTLQLLRELETRIPERLHHSRVFFTGSGGRALADRAGCRYIQEVNAIALCTERLHPAAGSVVDLGGQDAKIIIWTVDPHSGRRRKFFSMNDKCAGGTGSVIDRIASKLGLTPAELSSLRCGERETYPVAARCGVFAETDINSLQKQGVPREALIASLYKAIVQQNLSVLARGATLRPPVLLLGGPHAFLPGLVEAWQRALRALWEERGIRVEDAGGPTDESVRVPDNACYFAALGAIYHGVEDGGPWMEAGPGAHEVIARLERDLAVPKVGDGEAGLLRSRREREGIRQLAAQADVGDRLRAHGTADGARRLEVVIGLDGGSTSTKAVMLDPSGELVAKAYCLSGGDPIADARDVLSDLESQAVASGCRLEVRGLGVTGYAKDLLGTFLGADLVLVETVAHARSALKIDSDVDVVVDVGGQDIKVLILRDGRVRDFKLNSQCSAGNGYFLQSTARRFGIPLDSFADHAFRAKRCPAFHVGCAVFLEADIVNFQQIGWTPEEILAGLVRVLPRNIWLHVVGEPNLERLGRSYLLQGGTQRNQAAVKAQSDFIHERVRDAQVRVHPHAGESGALGVALELHAQGPGGCSQFVGFSNLRDLRVRTRQDESTRCTLCPNRCQRTILEAETPTGGVRHFVVASCDAGRVLPGATPPATAAAPNALPDFSARMAREAFRREPRVTVGAARSRTIGDRLGWLPGFLGRQAARRRREKIRIGIPRALNLYQTAPFFMAYLHSLGVSAAQIEVSGVTTESLFRRGARRGAIDNCFPSKLALAHVHDLVTRKRIDMIFLPILLSVPQEFDLTIDASICPSSQATPEVIKAAFTREGDQFADHGMRYCNPALNMAESELFARQMLRFWGPLIGVTPEENARALQMAGEAHHRMIDEKLREPALAEIRRLENEGQVGIVVLGRPYHNDPGLNHHIFRDLNRLGYPIFDITSLPRGAGFLGPLFSEDIMLGRVKSAMDISDVWRHSFSANSNAKVWAAKVVARHPNLVAMDVSSFRCGHDAPIYATVEAILEASRTPYFTFHEIDENRATGAIRLRVETIHYFLKEYRARYVRPGGGIGVDTRERVLLAALEDVGAPPDPDARVPREAADIRAT